MKKTIITLLVGAILASAPLAAVARAPSAPSKKPDAVLQHKAEDQTGTRPTAKQKAKSRASAKHKAKAKAGPKAQKNSANDQMSRDRNLN